MDEQNPDKINEQAEGVEEKPQVEETPPAEQPAAEEKPQTPEAVVAEVAKLENVDPTAAPVTGSVTEPEAARSSGSGKIEPTVSAVVEKIIDVYKNNALSSILLAGLPAMLIAGYSILVVGSSNAGMLSSDGATGLALLGFFLVIIFAVILSLRAYLGLIRSSMEYLDSGKTFTLSEAFNKGAGGAVVLILASIAYGLIVMGGLFLLIIPGVLFALRYFLVPVLTVTENKSVGEAFSRSKELTDGRYGLLGGLFGVAIGISILASIVGAIIPYFVDLFNIVYAPASYIAYAVVYKSLKEATPSAPAPAATPSDTVQQ